jgi:hypothetical protein
MKFNASTLRLDLSFQPDGAKVAVGRTITARIDDRTERLMIASLVTITIFIVTILLIWRDIVLSTNLICLGIIFNLFFMKVTIQCLVEDATKLTMPL